MNNDQLTGKFSFMPKISVTIFSGLVKTISIPTYEGLVFKTANKDTSNTFIIFNSVNFIFSIRFLNIGLLVVVIK